MHRIRLAGPWEMTPLDPPREAIRIRLPCAWGDLPGNPQGTVRFRRTFHAPSGLEAGDRVWVTLPTADVSVSLDEKTCLVKEWNEIGPAVDITSRLDEFHVLDIVAEQPFPLEEPVRLVIMSGLPE